MYELALELGLFYYPRKLIGFGFNRCYFLLAFEVFGEEDVNRAMNDKIVGALAQSNTNEERNETFLAWILKAATYESVCLKGLYTLLRFDPTAVMHIRKVVE